MRGALFSAAAMLAPGPALACALELILAVDVSGSVDGSEYALQTEGLAAAFETEVLAEAIGNLDGPVMVTLTQWSGLSRQRQVIGWRRLDMPDTLLAFAAEVRAVPRAFRNYSTAIGEALSHASGVSADNPLTCARRVIDVSGDGVSNEGRDPRGLADGLAARGYVVNAIVIRGADPDPYPYYRDEVIAGDGAFVETAEGFEDYPEAILRKLLREIDPPLLVGWERVRLRTTRGPAAGDRYAGRSRA